MGDELTIQIARIDVNVQAETILYTINMLLCV